MERSLIVVLKRYFHEKIDLQGFILEMYKVGFLVEANTEWRKESVSIRDSLQCAYERRDRHLTLSSSQLLNSDDLEDLYQRAIKIIVKRRLENTTSFEAPFGGGAN
jgi:hypothetical protein